MRVLPVEARLPNHPQRDASHRWTDRGSGDRGCDLRDGDQPELLRQQNNARAYDRANAWNDDVELLPAGRVVLRAGGRCHDHAGNTADGHHGADQSALPPVRLKKHPKKRADAGRHIRHEEIERHQCPEAVR